jgi:hypothetical protein
MRLVIFKQNMIPFGHWTTIHLSNNPPIQRFTSAIAAKTLDF